MKNSEVHSKATTSPEDRSPAYYYVCGHQASNSPCAECQPGQEVMPDDWAVTYDSPGAPGLTDSSG